MDIYKSLQGSISGFSGGSDGSAQRIRYSITQWPITKGLDPDNQESESQRIRRR